MGLALCCSLLTGCEAEDYFGATGQYVLQLGEDVFGTGHQGVTGGEGSTDPQSNEETHIFQNYNIKKVEKAPKEEKVAYDFSGPENKGISPTQQPAAATIKPIAPADNVDPGTVVVITAGHCSSFQKQLEPFSKQSYKYIAQKALAHGGGLNKDDRSYTFLTSRLRSEEKEFYKIAEGKNPPSGKDGVQAVAKIFKDWGFIINGKKGYTVPACQLKDIKFYKEYHAKVDKFVTALAESGQQPQWVKDTTSTSTGYKPASDRDKTVMCFKYRAMGGDDYKGTAEHTLNYKVAKQLKNQLTKKGYNVVLGRNSDNTTKLSDGTPFSNKNMSTFAKKQKAVIHFVIHWDPGNSKGIHTFTGNAGYASKGVVQTSEKAAVAMYSKGNSLVNKLKDVFNGGKTFSKANTGDSYTYTTLNFADVPTVIVECGYLNDGDVGKFIENEAKWVKARLGIFIAGIKAASGDD